MTIFTHVTVGTNDLNKARSFYDTVLKPANGQAASVGNGVTVSFEAPSRAAIHAFHAAALAAGSKDEGAPGTRDWAPNAYAAYTRDTDGNKLAVYCFQPA